MFKSGDTVSMFSKLSLTDCLDGAISSKIKIIVNDVDNSKIGTYSVTFEASNNYGDVINRQLPVNIVNDTADSPQLTLSDYLIYVDVGASVDARKYLVSVEDKYDEKVSLNNVEITSMVDTKSPGVHQVKYTYTDSRGLIGHTFLTVIVGEG